MRETQEKQIGDFVYRVKPLGAYSGNKVLMRIGKALLPAIRDAESLKTLEGAVSAISGLLSTLTETDMLFVVNEFAGETRVYEASKGRDSAASLKNIFDSHFSGSYKEQWEWLTFSFEVNFGFLDELKKTGREDPPLQGATMTGSSP